MGPDPSDQPTDLIISENVVEASHSLQICTNDLQVIERAIYIER